MVYRLIFSILFLSSISHASDVGMVAPFLSTSCPSGWKSLDSTSYWLKADYPQLVAVLPANTGGKVWGNTSSSVFSLPNLSGRFIRSTGGNAAAFGLFQDDDFKSHTHVQNAHAHDKLFGFEYNTGGYSPAATIAFFQGGFNSPTNVFTATNQNTGGTETRPTNISLISCVKVLDSVSSGENMIISSVTIVAVSSDVIQNISPSADMISFASFGYGALYFCVFLGGLWVGKR